MVTAEQAASDGADRIASTRWIVLARVLIMPLVLLVLGYLIDAHLQDREHQRIEEERTMTEVGLDQARVQDTLALAIQLIGDGKPDVALALVEEVEPALAPKIRRLYHLIEVPAPTRGVPVRAPGEETDSTRRESDSGPAVEGADPRECLVPTRIVRRDQPIKICGDNEMTLDRTTVSSSPKSAHFRIRGKEFEQHERSEEPPHHHAMREIVLENDRPVYFDYKSRTFAITVSGIQHQTVVLRVSNE